MHDAGNPAEVMHDVVEYATAGRSPEARDEIVRMIQETAHESAVYNFASGCEVADMLVQRLDFGPDVREALRFTFERWSGTGFPTHAKGEAIPPAMRVVHLSHDMEAIARVFSMSTPSRRLATAATGRTTPRWQTSSSPTGASGWPGSARSSRGTPCSPSSPSRTASCRASSSTTR